MEVVRYSINSSYKSKAIGKRALDYRGGNRRKSRWNLDLQKKFKTEKAY